MSVVEFEPMTPGTGYKQYKHSHRHAACILIECTCHNIYLYVLSIFQNTNFFSSGGGGASVDTTDTTLPPPMVVVLW